MKFKIIKIALLLMTMCMCLVLVAGCGKTLEKNEKEPANDTPDASEKEPDPYPYDVTYADVEAIRGYALQNDTDIQQLDSNACIADYRGHTSNSARKNCADAQKAALVTKGMHALEVYALMGDPHVSSKLKNVGSPTTSYRFDYYRAWYVLSNGQTMQVVYTLFNVYALDEELQAMYAALYNADALDEELKNELSENANHYWVSEVIMYDTKEFLQELNRFSATRLPNLTEYD